VLSPDRQQCTHPAIAIADDHERAGETVVWETRRSQMAGPQTFQQRWHNYTATKTTLFWTGAASAIATMVVGFTVGGWVTGGTAAQMSRVSASGAQAELAATICVAKFIGGPDAKVQLATLKESNSWGRDTIIEKGGWVALPGMKSPVSGAADRCAQRLMETDLSTSAGAIEKKG
jgi:hypothetical protein